MNKPLGWFCIATVLFLPACGLLQPGSGDRILSYQQDIDAIKADLGPLKDKVAANSAAGVPWYQTAGELAAAIGGSLVGVQVIRGPADKAGKLAKMVQSAQTKGA